MNVNPAGLRFIRWFVQLATAAFLGLYAFNSAILYSNNRIWFWVSILLFLLAMFRRPSEAFAGAFAALLLYGGFVLYQSYQAEWTLPLGMNDLLWLALFPYMAAVGSIGKLLHADGLSAEKVSIYEQLQGGDLEEGPELNMVEDQHGFLGGTAFLFKLEEEVLRALRERKRFVLLVVEIEQFRSYRRLFGYDQTQFILNQTAEFIVNLPEPPAVRGYLGDGKLAILVSSLEQQLDEPDALAELKDNLSESFFSMLLLRPRRESTLKIRLRFGSSECPVDGIEARSLLEKAQSELEWNEVSVKK
ncbi:MAG: Diguanylate cyclase, domain [Paenibacillaceae bacterium]|jgi:GGDEF domain-containing protein|nr:Diguanylate cyclase, domain [Paenibacillaceae bacterium]